ncbi:MAG: Decarbamoylnovobiocin carbamoyltransferase [Alphaproteobacteria bacterium MarineAlpha10_Bin2]|nr:MAG: Decarbamoylnovobiocin carbamoyltransferase [Alphaproteobacteria bacterium MarineAlpha10_Bin2]
MIILGVHPGYHEAAACLFDDYRMVSAVSLERLTRRKIDGGRVPDEAIDECLAIAGLTRREVDAVVLGRGAFAWRYFKHFRGSRLLEGKVRHALGKEKHKSMERELVRAGHADSEALFDGKKFLADFGFRESTRLTFYNHHLAHALPTLFHTDWQDALLYTSDGGGDNVQYSHRIFQDGALSTLYGGDECFAAPARIDSLGLAYGYATQALGWRINRHEGKLTGLAALGQPSAAEAIATHFKVDAEGQIQSGFATNPELRQFMFKTAENISREDMAASIQEVLEQVTLESVRHLLARYSVRRLGLCGGVFGNVRLNRLLAEETDIDEVFVYPAMSDQGLPAGGVLQFLLERDGMKTWLAARYPLETLYFGRDWGTGADKVLGGTAGLGVISDNPVDKTAELLMAGNAVAIFSHGMEYGPRALGARSILASPADAGINDALNQRLSRSEFMPFAPVIAEDDAATLFDIGARNSYTAHFMTITCNVKQDWRARIPAVVHVDGTARPQIIRRAHNPLYYDILAAFKQLSGLPTMINTSFNVHEEPIINRPEECAQALLDDRVDYVVTDQAVYRRESGA